MIPSGLHNHQVRGLEETENSLCTSSPVVLLNKEAAVLSTSRFEEVKYGPAISNGKHHKKLGEFSYNCEYVY